MRVYIIALGTGLLLYLPYVGLTEEESFKRDLFTPPFRKIEKKTMKVKERPFKKPTPIKREFIKKQKVKPQYLDLEVEGIILSDNLKHAIIDGHLYKEGDIVENKDAKIVKIDKGRIFLMFSGVLYEVPIGKNIEEKYR